MKLAELMNWTFTIFFSPPKDTLVHLLLVLSVFHTLRLLTPNINFHIQAIYTLRLLNSVCYSISLFENLVYSLSGLKFIEVKPNATATATVTNISSNATGLLSLSENMFLKDMEVLRTHQLKVKTKKLLDEGTLLLLLSYPTIYLASIYWNTIK